MTVWCGLRGWSKERQRGVFQPFILLMQLAALAWMELLAGPQRGPGALALGLADAVAYLPKHKVLCTGDACVNGAFNFMGHSNSASWVKCLDKMKELDVAMICPGHGKVAGKDLLDMQRRYFVDLRSEVKKGLDSNQSLDAITAGIDLAWYKEWTGKAAKENKDNVKHVYEEMTGKIDHNRIGSRPAPLDYLARESVRTAELPAVLRPAPGE